MPSHYDTLGIAPDASTDEMKTAYRRLARQFHPDVDASPRAHDRFTTIAEAYRVLSDPRERLSYNATVLATRSDPTTKPSRNGVNVVTRRELHAAWQRVGAYTVTGALTGAGYALVSAWLSGGGDGLFLSDTDWWRMWWFAGMVSGLVGAIWGIDSNFVTSDFLERTWQRVIVRLLRFIVWIGGVGYLTSVLGVYLFVTGVGVSIGAFDDLTLFLVGLPAIGMLIGFVIALIATLRDH